MNTGTYPRQRYSSIEPNAYSALMAILARVDQDDIPHQGLPLCHFTPICGMDGTYVREFPHFWRSLIFINNSWERHRCAPYILIEIRIPTTICFVLYTEVMSLWLRAYTTVFSVSAAICLVGCTTQKTSPAVDIPERGVNPIIAELGPELLSPQSVHKHTNPHNVSFVRVDPQRCAGVAQEVDPPFLMNDPVALYSGTWVNDQRRSVMMEEIVAVYHSDFPATDVLERARATINSCLHHPFTIYTRMDSAGSFQLLPLHDSGSPQILLWSFVATQRDWACDNALVSAYNAAIEITSCTFTNGTDVLSHAQEALARINKLAQPLD